MAVMKVIEIMADSDKSWEDATRKGIAKASKSLKGIRSAWVQNQSVTINEKGEVDSYRINLKLSFEVH
ncbi:MAG: dodecin domain-containing protein [Bacteroidetes bacterium]|nr:dodecin domain-containing protein [Bacteroidota bacterium]